MDVLHLIILNFVYKSINKLSPSCFHDYFQPIQFFHPPFEIEFLFLGASISNLVYLFGFSFSSNLISFFLYIIYT